MEREVGGGIRMGNTCKPMAVSCQCMTKSTTIKKIIIIFKKEKIKKKEKKKKKKEFHVPYFKECESLLKNSFWH